MTGIVWRDERPLAGALYEPPALVGLEVVVVLAIGIGVLKSGREGLHPVMAVIDLPGQGRATLDRADRIEPLQRRALGCGVGATEVGYADHGLAPGDDRGQEGVALGEELLDDRDRHRPQP